MRLEGKVAVIVGAGQSPGEGIGSEDGFQPKPAIIALGRSCMANPSTRSAGGVEHSLSQVPKPREPLPAAVVFS